VCNNQVLAIKDLYLLEAKNPKVRKMSRALIIVLEIHNFSSHEHKIKITLNILENKAAVNECNNYFVTLLKAISTRL
jgi:hypothetical protein